MASFVLNWTPTGGSNSSGQEVQYKESVDSTWLVAASLSASANTYEIEDLDDNVIYDFRVVNLCSVGGPTSGTSLQNINIICPTVGTTPTHNSVSFSFTHPTGTSLTEYRVDLMNGAGNTVLAFKNITSPSGTVSDSFTGLSASTSYNLRVTCKAGSTFSKVCPLVPFSTTAVPTCSVPSGLTVVIDEES